ncbi:MAG: epoxide hydrolase N-terminal domain-containing protein, partial [Mesorhizobium sp.]|nr:epoxide hydrolase N-terminal domain-containing protein [Mesorhizobium sp.]
MDTDSRLSRRQLIAASATAGTLCLMTQVGFADPAGAAVAPAPLAGGEGIRPFRAHFPDSDLSDLRRRILATRWPSKEVVTDDSQGVQLATIQALANHWGTKYDWRRCEARINAFP